MTWLWSDDLARCLIAAGLATEEQLVTWLQRPYAVASEDGDALRTARVLLGEGTAAVA